MRIGITARFQNSYFSGSTPQNAIILGKVLQSIGHEVYLLKPAEDPDWFIDVKEEADKAPRRITWSDTMDQYDLIVEVTWNLPSEKRPTAATRVALFQHYSPIFYDMESSVYAFNPLKRDFTNLTEIWTWNHFEKQDIRYLEFLSGKPVYTIPYMTNLDALDSYCKETQVPTWFQGAAAMDVRVVGDVPPSMSWSARIVESNVSNTSHCLVPLNIVSEIRRIDPVRFSVHNGEHVIKNGFFQSNVAKNLILPDMSGNFIPRIRLPDLCREKSFLISHQRFRPIKGFLIDALYLGIPILHNCDMLKGFGYKYDLNQIQDAVKLWVQMKTEYGKRSGYFSEKASEIRKGALRTRFGLNVGSKALEDILKKEVQLPSDAIAPSILIEEIANNVVSKEREIRIAFCDMWADFQPEHNFFMSLFKWAGAQNNFSVRLDFNNPSLVIFGPFGDSYKRYAGVPKVFFTGENAPSNKESDTFLNLGYEYNTDPAYIRLPLWVLEINWFGADPDKIVNPRPVSLESCLKQDLDVLDSKKKFCAFVATNPKCQNRNIAFHILNQWRGVDAGGRLFCNLASGPIPAGLGGGGGELSKVEFYKQYKYAITYENESSSGYTTEKLFHAKVAGCVPIYWGDKFVDRDFDSGGFINANSVATPQELIALVEKVENDPALWRKMASVPALTEFKRNWCQRSIEEIVKQVVKRMSWSEPTFSETAWKAAASGSHASVPIFKSENAPTVDDLVQLVSGSEKRIVTATNKRFVPSAINLVRAAKQLESKIPVYVYVWLDVDADGRRQLTESGATVLEFPVGTDMGWSGFWEPQHFAWKLWIHAEQSRIAPKGTLILYMDAGIDIVFSFDNIWTHIQKHGMCIFDDGEQTNRRWCHPILCEKLKVGEEELNANQIWAGCIGFMAQGAFQTSVTDAALQWAKQREVIVGDKWKPYSSTCFGHRHDQSILSILTQRVNLPRMALRDVYCDKSRRAAENWNVPFYVHRGNPRMMVSVASGIDEAYVINLEQRKDRLENFKKNTSVKDISYVWKGVDGRKLTLNADIARLFRDNDFKWKKSVMGCAISHMGLWEKLANDTVAKSYLIMEDDVRFHKDWMARWIAMSQHIPADADVIYLGGVLPPNKPALPAITESVNPYFAKVARNSLFGGSERRYFHFCNYSYILTQNGARKLIRLVQQRGIFTSGDHMIVNNGDGLLNLYFTTPLLSDCIQEDDPVYQKSEFNNFNRVDSFDSDIWNNMECFSQEEITHALAEDMRKIEIKVVNEPLSDVELKQLHEEHAKKQVATAAAAAVVEAAVPVATVATVPVVPVATTKEKILKSMNEFLRAVATRKTPDVKQQLGPILKRWTVPDAVKEDENWIRVFEKLVLSNHPELQNHRTDIEIFIRSHISEQRWSNIVKHWNISSENEVRIFELAGGDGLVNMLEFDWIQYIFGGSVEVQAVTIMSELLSHPTTPILLYQNPAGKNMAPMLHQIVAIFQQVGKQLILLHMSDEFARDDIQIYNSPAVKHVFRTYWRPGIDTSKITILPLGYVKERGGTQQSTPTFPERKEIWSFVGSADRPGRHEALDTLKLLQPAQLHIKPGWSSPHALGPSEYCNLLKQTRFVPCMKGSSALESFRMYEALEHGAIPFYVPSESHQCQDEYHELFGNHPLLAVPSWKEAVEFLKHLAEKPEVMERHRQVCMEWWRNQKETLKMKIKTII